jgi:hypothetical protein
MKATASPKFTAQGTNHSELSLPQGIRFSQNQVWEIGIVFAEKSQSTLSGLPHARS